MSSIHGGLEEDYKLDIKTPSDALEAALLLEFNDGKTTTCKLKNRARSLEWKDKNAVSGKEDSDIEEETEEVDDSDDSYECEDNNEDHDLDNDDDQEREDGEDDQI